MKISEYRKLVARRRKKSARLAAHRRRKDAAGAHLPNLTEALFARLHLNGRPHLYQPPPLVITRVARRRYTPDFETTLADGRALFVEVKGSYRLQSEDRARLAWEIAAEANASAAFAWAKLDARTRRFAIEVWEDGGRRVYETEELPR